MKLKPKNKITMIWRKVQDCFGRDSSGPHYNLKPITHITTNPYCKDPQELGVGMV